MSLCARCGEQITGRSETIPLLTAEGLVPQHYHPECSLRMVIGGLNHLRGRCSCCGGTEPPDPEDLTKREAAILAVALWKHRHPL
jgi:hypothetical protein